MRLPFRKTWILFVTLIAAATTAAPARSDDATDRDTAQQDRIDELEKKVDVLTDELSRMRTEQAVPESGSLQSFAGMGPAASKVYGIAKGLSIGGYAEGYYAHLFSNKNQNPNGDPQGAASMTDALRTVLYVGYKFNENLVFNSEFEWEHAGVSDDSAKFDVGGEAIAEFAALDWRLRPWATLRTGLMLLPIGFINQVHEPPFFNGVSRPEVEQVIIPTTWRENGVGLYGDISENVSYSAYLVTGLDSLGFGPDGIAGGRTLGNQSRAEDVAGVVRVDWRPPLEGVLLGGSLYGGGADQGRSGFGDAKLMLWELHAQYRWQGLQLRALYTQSFIDGASKVTRALVDRGDLDPGQVVGNEQLGGYVEAAYDVMPFLGLSSDWSLTPFFRVEYYNTQQSVPSGFDRDKSQEVWLFTPGIGFKPTPNVVYKLDFRSFNPAQGKTTNQVELGFGVAF
ncbi:MAG TPA: hypothetical protein VMH82_19835 [Myxococcota bacterium]|nr:hypothetical protein [Myxococcota bacterium]